MSGGAASSAQAFEISDFKAGVLTKPDDDTAYFQTAGGRPPYGITDFSFKVGSNKEPEGSAKSLRIDIPPGLAPNFAAIPKCTVAQLSAKDCPVESQIGMQEIDLRATIPALGFLLVPTRQSVASRIPVYNLEHGPDQVARFGVNPAQAPGSAQLGDYNGEPVDTEPILIDGAVRDSDNGLYFTIPKLPKNPAIAHVRLIFWGVPGASDNDPDRNRAETVVSPTGSFGADNIVRGLTAPTGGNRAAPAALRNVAFLTNPTTCAGVQTSNIEATSAAGEVSRASYTTPVGVEGCADVPFAPTVTYGAPGDVHRDAPTPLKVHLQVPQTNDADRRGTAHVKALSVTLPPGTTISPSAANGLQTCTDAQFGKGTSNPVACPAGSKVGTTKISSPLLDGPLTGDAYVGAELPGQRYRLFVDAYGFGIKIRLTGVVRPDPATGQLTTTFDDNPQLPFSDFELQLNGGPNAIVASPQQCGAIGGSTAYVPFSGTPTVNAPASINVVGCEGFPFAPAFGSTVGATQAGAYTPLTMAFNRPDGNQYLSGLVVTLPPGQLAKIRGVQQCADAAATAGTCPESSRIGSVTTAAGPGSAPYTLGGALYFTGPYRDGQFGAVAVIRAIAGPYDLGTVVVRQQIRIDPNDARVVIVSDPLPQILEGVPLRVRDLKIAIDRKGFTRNPTSCTPTAIGATQTSIFGNQQWRESPETFTDCNKLAFTPKLSVALRNRSQMKKNRYPQVRATLTQKEGQSGIKSTTVELPKALALAASNANGLCEVAAAQADACPKASIVGQAVAETPILNKPLKGPVYFVKGQRTDPKTGRVIATLPTLMVPLRGDARIIVRAVTAVKNSRLVTTLENLPDAPITKFTLTINGGKHGIIAATRDLCKAPKAALKGKITMVGQSGKKTPTSKPTLKTACAKPKKQSAAARKRAAKKAAAKKAAKKKAAAKKS